MSLSCFLRRMSLFLLSPLLLAAFFIPIARAEYVSAKADAGAGPVAGNTHHITLRAAALPSGQLGYQMVSHKIRAAGGQTEDVTARYSDKPTIPGPAIVMTEGDVAEVTLEQGIPNTDQPVSLHVHGVHFDIRSDGTMKMLNGVADEAAFPGKPYTYKWTAAPGTAGTWAYHDHTFGNPMLGAEDKGLFGTLIVNPRSGKVPALINGKIEEVNVGDIKREFILWMHETTFWGMEVNNILKGKQVPLWTNPTVGARFGEKVRFHVIGLGTAFHTFHLHGHRWLQPGTTHVVDTVNIGPISRDVFVVQAGEGVGTGDWHFHCHVIQHMQAGMMGDFKVVK
ncbi:multicopper oxidase domain-containing protein [Methylocaldum sp.]|uniref:multicopper oxidase domain-containing protein n=1 Tax=Methylocaldum sp. TaxID=1969727 RepID=UPI002D72A2E1|nr:multicopper oxidase domain-containing protein [Methylocaldum sp.]HYE34470.1 multicopper oxidase domain-containing protein [Methylocaldum sp.]